MRQTQPPQQQPSNGRAGGYIPGRRNQIFREGHKSLRGQWQEGGDNVDTTRVQMQQIEELHSNLVQAYECDFKQIRYSFSRITDPDDDDRHTCLDLHFVLTYFCPIKKSYVERTIYTAKVVVPDSVKRQAEELRKTGPPSGHPGAIVPRGQVAPPNPRPVAFTTGDPSRGVGNVHPSAGHPPTTGYSPSIAGYSSATGGHPRSTQQHPGRM